MQSASSYMTKRGIFAGIVLMMVIAFLSSALSDSGFLQTVFASTGNNPLLAGLFYLLFSFFAGVAFGAVPGAIIGMVNSMYVDRFVRQNFERIMDERVYTRQLSLRTGALTVALTLVTILLFRSNLSLGLNLLIAILASSVGGLIGRGYAYHDMAQRREKKRVLETDNNARQHKAKRRLGMDISKADKAVLESAMSLQKQQKS